MIERCSTCELRDKEVINICDGRRLGYISDFEIELCSGRIIAVCIPGDTGYLGLKRGEEMIIAWEKIKTIGEDAILVEAPVIHHSPEIGDTDEHFRKKKRSGFFF